MREGEILHQPQETESTPDYEIMFAAFDQQTDNEIRHIRESDISLLKKQDLLAKVRMAEKIILQTVYNSMAKKDLPVGEEQGI